jgi:hypothetical protein
LKRCNSDGNLERARDKASVITQLIPLLQPGLLQDGLTPSEAVLLLVTMHIDTLQRALATGNFQPILAKLKAGAYRVPEIKKVGSSENQLQRMLLAQLQPVLLPALEQMGLSWGDALPELKQMAQADLDRCLVSGCVAPILEQLARSPSEAPTRSRNAAPAQARSWSASTNRVTFADQESVGDIRHDSEAATECACDSPIPSSQMPSDALPKQMTEADQDTRPGAPPIGEQLHFLCDEDGPFLAISHSAAPTPESSAAFVAASDQDGRDEKATVVSLLLPLLQPRLLQDGLPPEEAAPLLAKMHIDVLQRALATGNVQPILAKLKAAAYRKPEMKKVGSSENLLQRMLLTQLQPLLLHALEQMGLSWGDALPELKQMAQADLDRCLVSGSVAPILEQLARSQHAASTPVAPMDWLPHLDENLDETASTIAGSDLDRCLLSGCDVPILDQLAVPQSASPTPAACEASRAYSKSSPTQDKPTFDLEEGGRQPEGARRRKSKVDASASFPRPVASKRGSEAGVPILLIFVLLFCLLFSFLPRTPIDHPPTRYRPRTLSLNPRENVRAPAQAPSAAPALDDQGGGVYANDEFNCTGRMEVGKDSPGTSVTSVGGKVVSNHAFIVTSMTSIPGVPDSVVIDAGHAQCVECAHGLCVECEESEVWKFGGGAGRLY